MWKKLTLLVVAVVVLGLTGAARCELVARYGFDDGTASDSTYYYEDADGTFFGDAEVVDDPCRGAVLDLDGSGDYVKVLNSEVANFSTESFTFSFWAQCSTLSSWYYFWRGTVFEGLKGVNCFHDVDSGEVRFTLYYPPEPGIVGKVRVNVPDANFVTGKWIHIACMRDADADELRLYVNGELEPPAADSSNPQKDTVKNISNTGQLYIGADDRTGPTDFFYGRIDDFRVYNHALSVQELEWLASDTVNPNLASDPSPPDGSQNECDDVVLSWTAGDNAVTHDVYFGTDGHDVRDAGTADSEYRLRQPGTTYNAGVLESLQPGETYYWRIDEVGSSVWTGDVWKFRINDGKAHSPDPDDGRRLVPVAQTVLGWGAGCQADSHDVYFGTDYNDVNDADTSLGAYKGNQGGTSWDPCSDDPCGLDYSTDYYWRIDEVNGPTTWKGDTWSFRTESAIFDPNLRLWYKFNETAGTTARDGSGHDYDGTVVGTSGWDSAGYYNGCLVFDNNGHVVVPVPVLGEINKEITICMWLNTSVPQRDDNVIFAAGAGWEDYYMRVAVPDDDADVYWQAGDDTNDVLSWTGGSPKAWAGEWNHFAVVKDEDVTTMEIYLNGVRVKSSVYSSAGTLANVRNRRIKIGAETEDDSSYRGKMDDLMVYDRALTAGEIEAIFRGGNVGVAWAPRPYNGQTDVARDVGLSWRPGNYAVSHDVYFGTSFNDVNDATTVSSVYIRRQDPCEYDPPAVLELETTYYWRIDEVNEANIDSPWKGNVWQFAVANFLIVDDMESYDQADNWIHDTWLDGFENSSGAEVYVGIEPTNPAHGGEQSMIYLYYNDGGMWGDLAYYSEVEVDTSMLPIGPDWTEAGVKTLTLFFDGNSTNDANEQMYAVLEDTGGTYAQVDYGYYPDEDMNDIKKEEWYEWDIALSDFSGVDANNVKKLYIGFGIRGNPNPGGTPGGSGIVYFDDARLYLRKCVPWRLKPACDFTSDCKVDIADVGRMAESWLKSDKFVDVVEEPNTPVVYYEFNETSGGTAEDSSNNYDGVAKVDDVNTTDAFWESNGRFGGCIRFDRKEKIYCVEMPNDVFTNHITNQITISMWVNWEDPETMPGETNQLFSMHGGAGDVYKRILGIETAWAEEKLLFWDVSKGAEYKAREDDWSGGWNHYAFVKHVTDVNDGYLRIYLNSDLVAESDSNAPMSFPADNAWIGMATDQPKDWHDEYTGLLDDFRVYDYALSEAEIGWLASAGTGYIPLVAMVNIYDKEPAGSKAVNFRDVAKLMHSWGEEKLWPPE